MLSSRFVPPRASRRAVHAAEAVVERIIGEYLKPGVINLAPGSVHWGPPAHLLHECAASANEDDHRYGSCHGDASLLAALHRKLESENCIAMENRELMITPGANQAYAAALLATCDPEDEVVLFAPYYFSHLVAIQLLGLKAVVVPCAAGSGLPDVDALRAAIVLYR